MSDDMSVFKKMRDKITDEVNSATNKLQSMQIMDQIATSIGQQTTPIATRTEAITQQTLPRLPEQSEAPTMGHFNLAYDNSSASQEDDELNSETSPQHQLFNEQIIRRLKSPSGQNPSTRDKIHSSDNGVGNKHNSVIDIDHLSSDIEDDVEVDLLHEKEIPSTSASHNYTYNLDTYKTRYRELVHALRKLNLEYNNERLELQSQTSELRDQIIALDRELNVLKQRQSAESERKDNSSSPHQSSQGKQNGKIRDLEKLMAKCKESLKAKNMQLKILKDSLGEVDKFKDYIGDIKNQLKELRNDHETWTLSIAENKRVAHQEIEDKNSEINNLQSQLRESNNRISQLKTSVQTLESRLVSMSAAHQRERESLTKQLTAQKNSAIKQVQKENELHVERIRLDLEKSIEVLKTEILTKDELIIRSAEKQNELQRQNCSLTTDLESAKRLSGDRERDLNTLRSQNEAHVKEIQILKSQLESSKKLYEDRERDQIAARSQGELHLKEIEALKSQVESNKNLCENHIRDLTTLRSQDETRLKEIQELKGRLELLQGQTSTNQDHAKKNKDLKRREQELTNQVSELTNRVSTLESSNEEQRQKLIAAEEELHKPVKIDPCTQCQDYQDQLRVGAEQYEQSLFELNAKLDLLTTANHDQEKALIDLNEERTSASNTIKSLRSECDELVKKNASLLQVMQDNESEMQNQQDQLDQVKLLRHQLDDFRKENASINASLNQVKSELKERNNDLKKSNLVIDQLKDRLTELEQAHKNSSVELESVKRERETLLSTLDSEFIKRREADQKLVINILAALKNLETPDTSPGSDKTYASEKHESGDSNQSPDHSLPDPLKLTESLSSLALDKSTAYMTSNQRLQAVLLDNTMISDEVTRLKEELNALSQEKTKEVMSSIEEVERLRTENQALIHDQKAYDDHIARLEADIESTHKKLTEMSSRLQEKTVEASTTTSDFEDQRNRELGVEIESKSREIEQLKKIIAEKEQEKRCLQRVRPEEDVPSSTEYEYLKNIVYQFLMGREPITLARVISAIFKFEQEQIDQICKVQEVIHQVSG